MSRLPSGSVARPVIQFAAASLLAMAVLGMTGAFILRELGRREAVRDAKSDAALVAQSVVEPRLTEALLEGRPSAVRRLDTNVQTVSGTDSSLFRIKIWRPDGTILYSDEHRLIGKRYPLAKDDLAVIRTGHVEAGISDLSAPENRFERSQGKLLEVYTRVRARSGESLLFETYAPFSSIAAGGRRVWLTFAPALVGGLLVLALLQLPLAWTMARRLDQGRRDREELLRRAIDASASERRRIAADLHDGVVQDLAGVAFNLSAARTGDAQRARTALGDGATQTRQAMRQLRSLLVEIYPPDLQRVGLHSALSDLAAGLRTRGIEPTVQVAADLRISDVTESLLFRTAQEALRNVVRHSGAEIVSVNVHRQNGRVVLDVRDDGRGFDPGAVTDDHLGLRLLADAAAEAGGRLVINSAPGTGTSLSVEVPV